MLYYLMLMRHKRANLQMSGSNTSSVFIRKLALALAVFLACTLWRMIDYTVSTFARTSNGERWYSPTLQIELYPLESTLPECLPMAFCFALYKARLPWETNANTDGYRPLNRYSTDSSDPRATAFTHHNTPIYKV